MCFHSLLAACLVQCLAYACQLEPAVSEQEAVQLVKLLLSMANEWQGAPLMLGTQAVDTVVLLQMLGLQSSC